MTDQGVLSVLIQYNCIPHYRRSIFRLLCANSEVQFAVVAGDEPDTPFLKVIKHTENSGIRQLPARTWFLNIPGLSRLSLQPGAIAKMWSERPNVVIALGTPYSITAWVMALLGRCIRIPVLLWGHGLTEDESGPKWWLRLFLYRIATGQLLYGNYAKSLLVQKGFDPEELHIVFNSLNYDQQVEIANSISSSHILEWRRGLGVRPNEGLVVFTGRLQPVKRLDHLLSSIGELAQQGKRVHVAIVGDGDERTALVKQAEDLGIADLTHFLGANYNEEFLGLALTASDLCVVPSGAGLSVMHSLTYGTPVLLHNHYADHFPEWEAVEEGKTGFFYTFGDRHDLADKIKGAIFPIVKRNAMAEDCKAVIRERYNPHVQVDKFVQAVLWSLKAKTRG